MAERDTTAVPEEQLRQNRTEREQSLQSLLRRTALGLAPIGAAIAMVVHPHADHEPYQAISAAADAWLLAHVLFFASFTLLGVGTYLLLDQARGRVALLGRIGAAIFTVFYVGYVAMVGLSSALFVRAGTGLSQEARAGINAALVYILEEPAVKAVAGIGVLGFLIAVTATATVYRRRGVSIPPLALLFGAVLSLGTHSGLIAVAGMLAFLAGAAWIEYASITPHQSEGATDGQ